MSKRQEQAQGRDVSPNVDWVGRRIKQRPAKSDLAAPAYAASPAEGRSAHGEKRRAAAIVDSQKECYKIDRG